ncbi:hypothetical protein GCM10010387_67490 [Streptomyces inusitatus]|uniref:NlpC/P60 domain-containing protein n=1 Tax=Streptomyces inusitatus TaxID=68221 RepID=A0A918V3F8_9ACTN|nr:C40 family peptidase [Streptomyces inusitatus]GGZ64909.1 hypothetical protein GCM10010387_67490 [Streptomyces inusitatus]
MAGGNLPVTLLVLGGGIVMVWTGITDPEKGIVGEIGRVLRGEPRPESLKKNKVSGADLASAILAYEPDDFNSPGAPGGSDGMTPANFNGNSVIAVARQAIGMPYVWGGGNSKGPTRGGFDCSGLLQFAHKKGAGIDIPRVAEAQRAKSKRISASEARPGDSVFMGMPAYHCGLYIGNGQMIHAPYPGQKVRIEKVTNVKPGPITWGRFLKAPETASI